MSLSLHTLAPNSFNRENKSGSFKHGLQHLWHRYEAAQMRRARCEVRRVLESFDDETLASSGYSEDDIAKLRSGQMHPPFHTL
jgi:hypothetical protein